MDDLAKKVPEQQQCPIMRTCKQVGENCESFCKNYSSQCITRFYYETHPEELEKIKRNQFQRRQTYNNNQDSHWMDLD